MNQRGCTVALGLVLFCLSGCGKGSGQGQPVASPERPSGSSEKEDPALAPLSPATAPPGVVVKLRIENPGALMDGALNAAAVPLDWKKLLASTEEGRKLFAALDTKSSFDAVVGMNPRRPDRPYVMGSVGVLSVDSVLQLLDEQERVFEQGPDGIYFFRLEEQHCAVGRAIARSPARVVCSPTNRGLGHFLPYALRGFPTETLSDADIHVEFDMKPVRERYGEELKRLRLLSSVGARQLHVGNPKFDRALTDAATGLADEIGAIVAETETLKAQVFQEKSGYRTVVTAQFSGDSSFVAHALAELGPVQSEAPQVFDLLPSTASAASYSREAKAEGFARLMNILADLVSGRLEHEGMSPAFSQRVARLVLALGPKGGQSAFGTGPLTLVQVEKKEVLTPAWSAYGTTRSKAEVVQMLEDFSFVLSSRELKKMLPEEQSLPTLTKVGGALRGVQGASVYQWTIPAYGSELAEQLGADLSDSAAGGGASGAAGRALAEKSSGFVAVFEVKGHTWVSWSPGKEQLAETFRALSEKDSQRLGDLGSLSGVRSEPSVSAGYFLLDSLVGMAGSVLPAEFSKNYPALLRATPGAGKTPATYFFKVNRGSTIDATWELRVPTDFIQDAAALVTLGAAEAGVSLSK